MFVVLRWIENLRHRQGESCEVFMVLMRLNLEVVLLNKSTNMVSGVASAVYL